MKRILTLITGLTLTLGVCMQSLADTDRASRSGVDLAEEERVDLAIEAVPPMIMQVARRAAPDVFFTSAERYLKKDFEMYRVTGRLYREQWHVHVRGDGKLIRTESDNQADSR
ncbi:MAG: hypothetical protein Cons2KO_06610 [Congregibacter sp.]